MRLNGRICLAAIALAFATPAAAAENGLMIRAGELLAGPFIDAQKGPKVKAKQKVVILERRGGWLRVDAGGQTGWVRSLNVRLEEAPRRGSSGQVAQLRTGSSGRTATTGVKGLDETDLQTAAPNYTALAALGGIAVSSADAKKTATQKKLAENQVAYLEEDD